ncbi:MAG: integrase [Betaproteobacteria bacterium]
MTRIFEPKLSLHLDAPRLSTFKGHASDEPGDDFVVCYKHDGTPASRYGDLVWDFTAYNAEHRSIRIYFAFWGKTPPSAIQDALSRAIRRVTFALIWHRQGAPLSIGTISNYVTVLCAIAHYTEKLNLELANVFSDPRTLLDYAQRHCSGWMAETLGSLLGVMARIGSDAVGFEVAPKKTIVEIKHLAKSYRSGIKQHAPIPTRIYSAFITGLQNELQEWTAVAEHVLPLFQACGADPLLGRIYTQQRDVISKKLGLKTFEPRPTFKEICPPEVMSCLETQGRELQVKSLSSIAADTQLVCKLLVQTFTGMRDDEVCSLPYHCLEVTVTNGRRHFVVKGRTTKLNHGFPKQARWVTNEDGYNAILVAQAIADAIYAAQGVTPLSEPKYKFPLFVSPAYMNLASKLEPPIDGFYRSGSLEFRPGSTLEQRLLVPIEAEDLKELEQIDPHRAWNKEANFQIGMRWVLKTHQLRRSLALYAQRSGLVSLPTLKRQLQHLTEEMSRYYAKGSAFAKNFIGDEKEHFGKEWQAAQAESSALSYIFNVLLSKDIFFGGHANWVEHRLKGGDGTVLVDRAATFRRFDKGEIAYRETLMGGCTSLDECNHVALNWLDVACLRDGCKNMVGNLKKLERVIAAQESFVSTLAPDSIEYRTEMADLSVLIAARDKAKLSHGELLQ